ncbi:hypothetical protein TYRP_018572 [Tyrophagus putrescentiae]|nr:hypothetical protein TYRP_018572 [Tyrophagus putrescentiae]
MNLKEVRLCTEIQLQFDETYNEDTFDIDRHLQSQECSSSKIACVLSSFFIRTRKLAIYNVLFQV